MRHNEGQGKVQHAPDIVRASTTEPISALRSTIGSLWSAGCAWPRDRLNPDAASRSVVDFDPRLVADAAECLSLGLQTRRARPKSFLRRPPRARKRPSEPSCCRFQAARNATMWRYTPRLHRLYRLGAAPRRRRSAACPLRGPPRQYVWAPPCFPTWTTAHGPRGREREESAAKKSRLRRCRFFRPHTFLFRYQQLLSREERQKSPRCGATLLT